MSWRFVSVCWQSYHLLLASLSHFVVGQQSFFYLVDLLYIHSLIMASAIPASAQSLPRFLLPRLSWQTTTKVNTIRCLTTATSQTVYPARRRSKQQTSCTSRRPNSNPIQPSILQNVTIKRAFHATPRRARDHHFDTLKFVQRLQEEGFTEPQAVAMMKVLSDVIEERYLFPPSTSLTPC